MYPQRGTAPMVPGFVVGYVVFMFRSRLLALSWPAVLVLAWWWPNRPRDAGPAPGDGRLRSVSFAPFRPGQSPLTGRFPNAAQVEADLALLAPHVRGVRTYASLEGAYDVPALAARHGLKMWLGIWLGTDRTQNAAEIARGIQLAQAYPGTVERVVVGNEVLLRRDLPATELAAALDQVRAAVRQPVTYADVWEFWQQFPELAAHVDVVTIHLLPYWEDAPTGVDRAVDHLAAVYDRMAALFPGKPIAIGETGWPSAGRAREAAVPGRVEQARFVREFVNLGTRRGFDYNLIEAFDQEWKYKSEGTVGAAWGLWTADRGPKLPVSGPVSPDPGWRAGALASVLLMGLLLAGALCARPVPGGRARGVLALVAALLGGALAYAHAGTWPGVLDRHLLLAAVVNLVGQLALAVLLMARAAERLSGRPPPPARTGRDATAAMRRLLRLRPARGDLGLDDLAFLFAWTAVVLQLLLLVDPRYRDFPLASFAVPLAATAIRAALRDLPRTGGGREEAWAGGVLAGGALLSLAREGMENGQAVTWTAAALLLAAPLLWRVVPRARRLRRAPA